MACSQQSISAPDGERALRTSSVLTKQYGEISAPFVTEYLGKILSRLGNGLYMAQRSRPSIVVRPLNTAERIACTPGNSSIFISKGLILSLASEAELSFVIAHEVAHELLGHVSRLNKEISEKEHQQLELEADRYAVGLIAIAGYDPRAAVGAIIHAYDNPPEILKSFDEPLLSHHYPDPQDRIQQIQEAIRTSGWRSPGTIDTREFRKLLRFLRG